ncbi:putative ECF sigma factor [Azospirillum argentinense]
MIRMPCVKNQSGTVMKDELGQHLDVLRRYALVLMRDPDQAEDLVQEALVKAIEGASSFTDGRDLRKWLLAIVHNTFVDRWRRQQAERQATGELSSMAEEGSPPAQLSHVHLGQTIAALMTLPVEQREALVLVALDGMSYRDAAECLGIPVGTLMSRLGRARDALRAKTGGGRQLASDQSDRTPSDRVQRPPLRVVK